MNNIVPVYDWACLSEEERKGVLSRSVVRGVNSVRQAVEGIVADVRTRGDDAVMEYTRKFDGVEQDILKVGNEEFAKAEQQLSGELKSAIGVAIGNVCRFHEAQKIFTVDMEITPGLCCRQVVRAIENVGLYVPAGVAPLPSTMYMLGIPAIVAGCKNIVTCVPPRKDGTVEPSILYVAKTLGISNVYKVGGAQAIAAMAYGTASIPKVDKIFGPGNPYVTCAKMLVAMDDDGAAFDMPAGPSEQLHIADFLANPAFVAADLLSQAEHSIDVHVVFVTNDKAMLEKVLQEVEKQVGELPSSGADIVRQSLAGSAAILVSDIAEAVEISNIYAPEHLVLNVDEPEQWLDSVQNAGSVFLGAYTPESLGDYASGTNHCLPTGGKARAYSGLSVKDFQKTITVQQATPEALHNIDKIVVEIAGAEGLAAHARAAGIRIEKA